MLGNMFQLEGNLAQDPKFDTVGSKSTPKCEIVIANKRMKDDQPGFYTITFWKKKAEVVSKYFSKGKPIIVEGFLKMNTFEYKGKKRSKLELVGTEFKFMSAPSTDTKPVSSQPEEDDECPF